MLRTTPPAERALGRAELGAYTMARVRTWIGGTRRRKESWHEPRNWFPHGVPDWNDTAVIGGYGQHLCRIAEDVDPVMAVHVLPGASLRVAKGGTLRIDGLFADPQGLICGSGLYNDGTLEINGAMTLTNVTGGGIRNKGLLCNRGRITTGQGVTSCVSAWGKYVNSGLREYV